MMETAFPVDRVPTIDECGAEIIRAMRGKRDDDLRHLGTLDEYIRVLIANNTDPVVTKIHFEHAIENRIQLWQPNPIGEPVPMLHMLDIIRAWTPKGGFEKCFSVITRWSNTPLVAPVPFTKGRTADLRLRTLLVLERYIPVSPQNENAAYVTYVAHLKKLLEDGKYRLYGARRLKDLGVIRLNDDSIVSLLDENPAYIAALVELAIDERDNDTTPAERMTALYAKCKARGLLLEFQNAVTELGGHADVHDGRVTVVELRGKTYEMNQSRRELAKTWASMPAALTHTLDRMKSPGASDVELGIATKRE